MIGYKAVYNYKGHKLSIGNPRIFPDFEMAHKYAEGYKRKYAWFNYEPMIIVAEYEGEEPKPCREYNGKRVYNNDFFTFEGAEVGDYVEEEIINNIINALPPACMRSNCMQCGEPSNHKIDENGKERATYATFKKVSHGIYEYCGDCFRGENIERGKEIPIVL